MVNHAPNPALDNSFDSSGCLRKSTRDGPEQALENSNSKNQELAEKVDEVATDKGQTME